MPVPLIPMAVPFLRVVDGISRRLTKQAWSALTLAQVQQIADSITSNVDHAMRFTFWPESREILEVTTVDNTVPWTEIDYAIHWKVYDAEPGLATASANEVEVKPVSAGLRLTQRTLDTVWVVYCPRPPIFNDVTVYAAGSYVVGNRVYLTTPVGANESIYLRAYECINNTSNAVTNTTDWKELVILDCIAEPLKLLCLADMLGNGEQERAQAADLRQQAEEKLHRAWIRTASEAL